MTELVEHGQLFIGGELVDPARHATSSRSSPRTPSRSSAACPHASTADIDRAVAAARTAFDEGPWPRMSPRRADRRRHAGSRTRIAVRHEEIGPRHHLRERAPRTPGACSPRRSAPMMVLGRGDHRRPRLPVRGAARTASSAPHARAPRAGRRRRGRRRRGTSRSSSPPPSSRPRCSPAARSCSSRRPRRRWTRYILAEMLDGGRRCRGRASTSSPPAARSASTWSRHPGVDKIAFTGSTAAGRRDGGRLAASSSSACTPGARRQVGRRSSSTTPTSTPPSPGIVLAALMNNGQACVAQTRILAAARPLRRGRRRARRGRRARWSVGDPLDPATEIGPLVAERQQRARRATSRIGQEEGAKIARRRRPPAGLDRGLVRRADPLRRRRQLHAHRPRGDLRPGRSAVHPVRRRGRRRADRQRLRLRPGRQRLDRRRRRTASTSPARSAPARTRVNTFSLDMLGPFGGYKNSRRSGGSSAPRGSASTWSTR